MAIVAPRRAGRYIGRARYLPATVLARDSVAESVVVVAGTVAVGGAAAYGAAQTDHTAPILTFVGAILVALITAFTTNRRQQHQLEAESDRQRRGLDAESARQQHAHEAERVRLELQLSHDRDMSDLGHVRALLDDAAMALHRASYARDDVMRVGPAAAGKREGVAAKIATTGTALDELADRLAVRFGPDADATTNFREAADALRAIDIEIGRPEGFDIVEQFQAYQAASARFDDARTAFLAAAAKTAGVKRP